MIRFLLRSYLIVWFWIGRFLWMWLFGCGGWSSVLGCYASARGPRLGVVSDVGFDE